jgi:hypothetical protein
MMSGLSPDALCRIFHNGFLIEIKSFLTHQIYYVTGGTVALNLYECAVSASNADLTL